jgi:DNA-binding XRE family transcriptional regulator
MIGTVDTLIEDQLQALSHSFRLHRNQWKFSYDELAELSGVSRQTLVAMVRGDSHGSIETWLRLCHALDTTFVEFLKRTH